MAFNKLHNVTLPLLYAFVVSLLLNQFFLDKGLWFADEGFLWYGVEQVLNGAVPVRDFMSYDPARYYWSAGVMSFFGLEGLYGLRLSILILQALAVFTALLLIDISYVGRGKVVFLLLTMLILVTWMFPRHKLYDISISILLVGTLTWLIHSPNIKRYFFTGLFVGLVAIFGRNHGLYGFIGSLGCIAFLAAIKNEDKLYNLKKNCLVWLIGVVVGYSPLLLMSLFIPGFGDAYIESIAFLFEIKSTNISLPVPWPWLIDFSSFSFMILMRKLIIGLLFVALITVGFFSLGSILNKWINKRKLLPAQAASAFLILPYAHVAFARADISHLAQGIFPLIIFLLTSLAASQNIKKWVVSTILLGGSAFVVFKYQPGLECFPNTAKCSQVRIGNDEVFVPTNVEKNIKFFRRLKREFVGEGQSIFIAPFFPGIYPLLDMRSPVWEIYALFPRAKEFEKKEIQKLKAANVGFVFLHDKKLDNRNELQFSSTHPLTYKYVKDNYDLIELSYNPWPKAYLVYKPKVIKK